MPSWSLIRITAWVNYQLLSLNSYSDYALIKLCNLGLVLIDQSERIFPDVPDRWRLWAKKLLPIRRTLLYIINNQSLTHYLRRMANRLWDGKIRWIRIIQLMKEILLIYWTENRNIADLFRFHFCVNNWK